MPSLEKSLQARDLGHLRIVAEHWGVELTAREARTGRQQLAAALLDPELIDEVVTALPAAARAALADLLRHGGRLPWPQFTRRHGDIREIGPARRDRQRPDRNPQSPAEILWYRALLARAFFDTPDGPQEFAFLPDDLLPLLPLPHSPGPDPLGRPASPQERSHRLPATDRIIDHATTLLAALRIGQPHRYHGDVPPNALQALLAAAGLLTPAGHPRPQPVRDFLEAPRSQAHSQLARAWRHSPDFDELRLLPGLQPEGDWKNNPLRTRQAVLDLLATLPNNTWWSLNAFIAAVKTRHPDFQRSEFDSWYLRDRASGQFLRGFEHWDAVEAALLRYLITGPLHWLMGVELAAPEPDAPPSAFRIPPGGLCLPTHPHPGRAHETPAKIHLRSDGRIAVPPLASRAARYQIARFCDWEPPKSGQYRYRLTPSSLARAAEQGLRVEHLIALLARHTGGIPPNLTKALKDWQKHGTAARVEQLSVLRLSSPEALQALRASRAARFLAGLLGPTAVALKPGAEHKVLAALMEMGYLGEIVDNESREG